MICATFFIKIFYKFNSTNGYPCCFYRIINSNDRLNVFQRYLGKLTHGGVIHFHQMVELLLYGFFKSFAAPSSDK